MGAARMIVQEEADPTTEQVGFRCPTELLRDIDAVAEKEAIPRTALIVGLLRHALARRKAGDRIVVVVKKLGRPKVPR